MVEGAGTPTSIVDDDRRDAAFLYSFAKAAKIPAPRIERSSRKLFVKPESESDFDCYASNLPDHFTLSRTLALYRLIAEGQFDFEYDDRVHMLANACERLENADPPSLKQLFEFCFQSMTSTIPESPSPSRGASVDILFRGHSPGSKNSKATYAASSRALVDASHRSSSLGGALACCNPYVYLCMCTCKLQVGIRLR